MTLQLREYFYYKNFKVMEFKTFWEVSMNTNVDSEKYLKLLYKYEFETQHEVLIELNNIQKKIADKRISAAILNNKETNIHLYDKNKYQLYFRNEKYEIFNAKDEKTIAFFDSKDWEKAHTIFQELIKNQ